MDPAKKKRVLKLLGGRSDDREQALELLIALDDDDLWREAIARVRQGSVVGITQVERADLPLLAAAPDRLPEVRALRSGPREMYFSTKVDDGAACFTHLESIHLTAAWGDDPSVPVPSLALLRHCPVAALHLIGVDLDDGALLASWPLRTLELRNGRWTTLPALPHLASLSATLDDDTTSLGDGAPALRRVVVSGAGLHDLRALAAAARLEEVHLDGVAALRDLGPLAQAVAAGAPLRDLRVQGATSLADLSTLAAIPALERVEVEADVDDLRPLAGAGLRWLAVRHAPRLRDLGPVAAFPGLTCVDLRGDRALTDLGPLRALSAVRVIALAGTGVRPDAVPPELRPYCTWAESPGFDELVGRPRHPDDRRETR
jgi:hypothetical protein